MTDYNNGKIYKLVSDATDEIYIGSTCRTLTQRLQKHKDSHTFWLKHKKGSNISSHKVLDSGGNVSIELIEDYPCNDNDELRTRERYHYDLNECVNARKPIRTKEDQSERYKKYYQENKGKVKEKNERLYQKNREAILAKKKIQNSNRTTINCVCGSSYVDGTKARHERTKKHQKFLIKI